MRSRGTHAIVRQQRLHGSWHRVQYYDVVWRGCNLTWTGAGATLAKEIRDQKLPIAPNCAARTVIADIEPIVRVSDELGIKIEAATFIGSSPIRQYTEDWTVDRIVAATEEAVTYAVRHGLPVMY